MKQGVNKVLFKKLADFSLFQREPFSVKTIFFLFNLDHSVLILNDTDKV